MAHKCTHCHGNGRAVCPRCGGSGYFTDKSICYFCHGNKTVVCPACNGKGEVED